MFSEKRIDVIFRASVQIPCTTLLFRFVRPHQTAKSGDDLLRLNCATSVRSNYSMKGRLLHLGITLQKFLLSILHVIEIIFLIIHENIFLVSLKNFKQTFCCLLRFQRQKVGISLSTPSCWTAAPIVIPIRLMVLRVIVAMLLLVRSI